MVGMKIIPDSHKHLTRRLRNIQTSNAFVFMFLPFQENSQLTNKLAYSLWPMACKEGLKYQEMNEFVIDFFKFHDNYNLKSMCKIY